VKPPFEYPVTSDTPVWRSLSFAAFEPRFLLESVEGRSGLARYSFIGFGDGSR